MLGTLSVRVDGSEVLVTAPRQRVVLAALLLAVGRPVSVERLVDTIWGETPPATARVTVQNYVKRLRATLGVDCIETTAEGYRIVVTPDDLDLLQFRGLVDRARSAARVGDMASAADSFRHSLELWRGQPLPDLAGSGWLESEIAGLVETRLRAVEEWAGAGLVSGRASEVVDPLAALVRRWPLRESASALLIRALHGCDRTADALAEYTRARSALVEELGIDPGEGLRSAHQSVLAATTYDTRPTGPPAQLPAVSPWLVGRDDAAALLDGIAAGRSGAIATVSGMAGVGKTTLAVHWGHRESHRFPDGQLYVNLCGYDPSGPPMEPGEALMSFLAALGVSGQAVPADVPARAALFRTLAATRRLLIVLDNARDVEQVRPLLPGAGGSVTVVTSRDRLTSLGAVEGARTIDLDVLSVAESVELLRRRLGGSGTNADPEAVMALVDHCARLPLALSIAAARVDHSRLSVAELATQLSDPRRGPLDVLRAGDRGSDLRAVLSWSTDHLDPETARVFRLLGLHPGPDFTPDATAHLVDRDRPFTHTVLDDLARAQLLIEHRPGRYAFHDLLRAHALELVSTHETHEERQHSIHRFLDHLSGTAHDAYAAVRPMSTFAVGEHTRGTTRTRGELGAGIGAARDWLTSEDRVVAAAIRHLAARPGFEQFAWSLAYSTGFERTGRGELAENLSLHDVALGAAIRSGDRLGEAWIRLGLGTTHTYLGSLDDARRELDAAHDIAVESDNSLLHLATHMRLTTYHDRCGEPEEALRHGRRALDLCAGGGDELAWARAQNALGWTLSRAGHHEEALPHCLDALAAHRRRADREGVAATLDSMGHIYLHLGRQREAIGSYVEAVEVLTETGRHLQLADVIWHLGDAYEVTGDRSAAHASWQSSLDLLDQVDHPNAVVLRAKLADRGLFVAPSPAPSRG